MELVAAWGRALAVNLFILSWACIVLWGIARLWPRSERPSSRTIWKAAKFWTIFLLAEAVIVGTFKFYNREIEPLFDMRSALSELPYWLYVIVGPLAFLVIYDFFNYWMHRAQHKWFWKQHRIHHSITHLSALNAYFHPTEPLFRAACIYIPITFLFGWGGGGWTVAVAMLNQFQGLYVHAPTKLNYGIARGFMVDNAFHRIHHSIEPRHAAKNFGAFTTLWDQLFGTAHFPAKDEWPEAGVADFGECETVGQYIGSPFMTRRNNKTRPRLFPRSR